MKMDGRKLISRGRERVWFFGDWCTKTVYSVEGEWRFFVKNCGEFIEVYHKNMFFSTKM